MAGAAGSNAVSDNAAATAAALRGAALAFGRQKKAEADANNNNNNNNHPRQPQLHPPHQQNQQHVQQHLPPPKQQQRRHPSVSPSRHESTITNAQQANALQAATSAAASSSSRDQSVGSNAGTRNGSGGGGRAGPSMLRPVSPGRQSTAARSSSSSSSIRSRSQSQSRAAATAAATATTDFGSSPSKAILSSPLPAISRTRTGGNTAVGGSLTVPNISTPAPLRHPRSTSFLAATLAASQAASPGITPSHTGQGNNAGGTISATSTGGPGPKPAHLSAALLASAPSEEKRRAAAALAAANLAAETTRVNDEMARYGIRIGQYSGDDEEYANLDTSPIPGTSSLVSMFEKSNKTGTRRVKADSHSSSSSPVRPPKPKAFTPPRSLSPVRRDETPLALAKTPIKTPTKTPTLARTPATPVTKETVKPPPKPAAKPPTKEEPTLQKEQLKLPAKPQPKPKQKPTVDTQPESQQAKPIPIPKPKPQMPATAQETSSPLEKVGRLERASTGSSSLRQHRLPLRELNDDDDVMARPTPPKPRVRRDSSAVRARSRSLTKDREPPVRAASSASRGPPPLAPPRRTATALVAHHTGGSASPLRKPAATASSVDGLASAIMAGSLAAARHPPSSQSASSSMPGSRSRTPPVPPAARSTSPTKRTGMLQTLRRDRSHSDDDDYDLDGKSSGNTHYRRSHYHRDGRLRQHKLHLSHAAPTALVGGGRHKHKHHEGSRKRWREAVTERQRRRYEAVWASNRGRRGLVGLDKEDNDGDNATVVIDDYDDDDTVPNVVVRDLWRRSRLPVDELAEVWDLVDETGTGRLGKAGFVVGLWLIDQRLRGRKIPARVSESVWSSARGMQGTSKQRRR